MNAVPFAVRLKIICMQTSSEFPEILQFANLVGYEAIWFLRLEGKRVSIAALRFGKMGHSRLGRLQSLSTPFMLFEHTFVGVGLTCAVFTIRLVKARKILSR